MQILQFLPHFLHWPELLNFPCGHVSRHLSPSKNVFCLHSEQLLDETEHLEHFESHGRQLFEFD